MRRRLQRLQMRANLALGRRAPLVFDGVMLRSVFDRDAGLRRVASGLQFTEGPVWDWRAGRLLFTDIPGNCIHELRRDAVAVLHASSDHANGLAFDSQGRLLACEHGTRRVSRRSGDGTIEAVADRYEGARLNSPNDVVTRADGSIWFTDPPYGISRGEQELPFQGVFRIDPNGTLHAVLRDFDRPNGLAFSPDGTTMYVADSSDRRHIRAFDVSEDNVLRGGEVFADMRTALYGVPDGLKVADSGRIFSTGPGGLWVIEPDGRVLGVLQLPEVTSNCAFGDSDGRGLYITATTSVYHVRLVDAAVSPSPPSAPESQGRRTP